MNETLLLEEELRIKKFHFNLHFTAKVPSITITENELKNSKTMNSTFSLCYIYNIEPFNESVKNKFNKKPKDKKIKITFNPKPILI